MRQGRVGDEVILIGVELSAAQVNLACTAANSSGVLPSPGSHVAILPVDYWVNNRRWCHDSPTATHDRGHATARTRAAHPTLVSPSPPMFSTALSQVGGLDHG